MFGFVSYNALSGLLLRDVLPDPDVRSMQLSKMQPEDCS